MNTSSRALRREFFAALMVGLRVVWPILSGLIVVIVALGVVIGVLEGWSVHESIYFAFITELTIGYGDFAPTTPITGALSVVIGICGLLLTAMVAAVAVKALTITLEKVKK